MRLLMLTQFYPPTIGGEEVHVQILSRAMAARGHDVAVATIANDGIARREMDENVRIYRLRTTAQRARRLYRDPERRHAPPLPDPEAMWNLLQIIREERPDIVHAHNWLLHSFLPLKLASKAKLVVTLHDYSLLCAQKRLMSYGRVCQGPQLTKCLKCAANHYGAAKGAATVISNRVMGAVEKRVVDMFLPVSHSVATGSGLIKEGLPFEVVPNFLPDIPDDTAIDLAPYLAQLPSDGYLLFVGDLVYDKGINVLLDAYSTLEEAPPLVLIGRVDDALRPFPPNVTVVGRWPHRAVIEAWRRCSIGLVPSVWTEPFGMVALEAMLSGHPVIASRIGGLADTVVDGVTGLLVPPADVEALRLAIKRLLGDEALCRKMGRAAAARAGDRHHVNVIVPQIEKIYQALLADDCSQVMNLNSWLIEK